MDQNMNTNEKKDQAKAEVDVTKRFLKMFAKKVDEIQKRYADRPQDFKLEDEEKKVLMKVNNGGILEGALAGIVSLVVLRKMRSTLLRKVFERPQQHHGTTTTQNPQSPMQQMIQQRQQSQQQQFSNNPFQKNALGSSQSMETPNGGFIINVMGWTMDMLFALMIGASVSMYRLDVDSILKEVSVLPLSPGHSAVSREFCPDAIDVLNQLREESGKGDNRITLCLKDPVTDKVDTVIQFAKNCERRVRYEAKLREEKGVSSPDYRVSIPPPGVPVPLEGEEEDSGLSSSSTDWVGVDSFSIDSSNNESETWADGFVQDQEESDRRQN
jgi:hypothetical protein